MTGGWPYGGPGQGSSRPIGTPFAGSAPYGGVAQSRVGPPFGYPAVTPTPPPRRKGRRRLLIGSGTALALVGVTLVATHGNSALPASSKPATTTGASASPSSTPADAIRDQDIQDLLTRRAVALRKGDLAGWMAEVDPAQTKLVAQQKQLFAGLRALPLSSYQWVFRPNGQKDYPVPAALSASVGPVVRSPSMRVIYQLRTYDPTTVAREFVPVVAERNGHLMLEADQTTIVLPKTLQEPWDVGPVAVAAGKHTLVVVSPADRKQLPGLVKRADAAVDWVSKMWPKVGSGHAVLYALRSKAIVNLYSVGDSSTADFSGVTAGAYDPSGNPDVEGTRVVLNPAFVTPTSKPDLLNDLLRHEFTHVAHWNSQGRGTPVWAIEGIAEYTSFRGHPTDQRVSGTIGPAARKGKLPAILPASKTFYAKNASYNYGMSWLTFQYMSEKYGEKKIRALFAKLNSIAAERGTKAQLKAEDAAFVSVLKLSEAAYVKKLNAWIAKVLRQV